MLKNRKIQLEVLIAIIMLLSVVACSGPDKTFTTIAEGPQDVISASYCGEVQGIMVGTELEVINQVHPSYDSFVKSKAAIKPLTSHQYINYLPIEVNGELEDFPAIISCKLKTADIVNMTYGEGKASGESNCKTIIRRDVELALAELTNQKLIVDSQDIIFEEDEVARMGPKWLSPWPYQTIFRDNDDKLHFRSKALLVPHSKFIPMPDRFIGTHYCHLPTSQYIKAVLLGSISIVAAE